MSHPRGSAASRGRWLIGSVVVITLFMSYQLGRTSVRYARREREASQEYIKEAAKVQEVQVAKQIVLDAETALKRKYEGARALLQAARKDPFGNPLGPPSFTDASWEIQKRSPYYLERNVTCGNEAADGHNARGMSLVQKVTHFDIRIVAQQDQALADARQAFEAAVSAAPGCQSAHLNLAILLFTLKDFEAGLDHLQKAEAAEGPLKNKAYLWKGFYLEQGYPKNDGWNTVYHHYYSVLQRSPEYGLEYFGVRAKDILESNTNAALHQLTVTGFHSAFGLQCIQRAVSRMLLGKEFSVFVGGYAALSAQEAKTFPERWYIFIRNMLDPFILSTAQEFYATMIAHNEFPKTDPQAKRFISANDPPARFLMAQYKDLVGRLADQAVKPTYTYFGSYYNQSVLASHRDRRQCEYTLTVNIDINPRQSQCPLGFSVKPREAPFDYLGHPEPMPPVEERAYVYPRPGDGVLIKGRNIIHWRDQMPPNFNCSQLFLHYVNDDFALSLS